MTHADHVAYIAELYEGDEAGVPSIWKVGYTSCPLMRFRALFFGAWGRVFVSPHSGHLYGADPTCLRILEIRECNCGLNAVPVVRRNNEREHCDRTACQTEVRIQRAWAHHQASGEMYYAFGGDYPPVLTCEFSGSKNRCDTRFYGPAAAMVAQYPKTYRTKNFDVAQ